jgi:imidazolonepropionase-like amidohydrolase
VTKRPLGLLLLQAALTATAARAQVGGTLSGTFGSGPLAITFEADSHRISRGGQIGIRGRFELAADTVTFYDVSGPIACSQSLRGRYLWKLDRSQLTFTLIEDACQGRSATMTGRVWTDQVSGPRALTGATLIDGTSAPPRTGMTILVAEGKITDVFSDGSRPIPPGMTVHDLRGKYVIPGLIDTHVHLGSNPRVEDTRPKVEARLRWTLLGGVTTVRDMAGDVRYISDLARAAKLGDIVSPLIYYSALFAGPDFFNDPRVLASSQGEAVGQVAWMRAVTPSTDWAQVVAEARGSGATGIKLYADLPGELLSPLVAEAHRQGMIVWAHAALIPARPHDLVNAGVDVLTHAPLLAREADSVRASYRERYRSNFANIPPTHPALVRLIDSMIARKTIVEPTLFVFFNRDSTSPPSRWAALITRELHRRGVPISAGTDGIIGVEGEGVKDGTLPNLHRELELLVDHAGLSPQDAIIAATGTAARVIGIDSVTGTITPGKRADLVVLSADPLADISNTRLIELVMLAGNVFERSPSLSSSSR